MSPTKEQLSEWGKLGRKIQSRFSDDEIRYIRKSPEVARVIAKEFGVSRSLIHKIRQGIVYASVEN